MPRVRLSTLITLAASTLLAPAASAATIFVRADLAAGANTGSSWSDAFRGRDALTRALASAVVGDEIWVAAGTYCPVLPVVQGGTGARTTSFALRTGVSVYGGFAGTESARNQRNLAANPTILTGDINQNDSPYPSTTGWAENSHHIVTAGFSGNPVNASAVLDGFTLRQAFANGPSANLHERGGGIIILSGSTPTLRNLTVINNRVTFGGGGLYINASSPRLEDCRIEANNGGSFGGGCDMATNCNPIWVRCAIIGNTATRAGGVEVFSNCLPQFFSCLFARNSAGSAGGGALFIQASTATLRNCTLVFNTVSGGGPGAAINGTTANLGNCIIVGNTGATQFSSAPTQSYSCVPAGRTDAGNIAAAPIFVNAAANDFRLAAGSPGIDAGNNALVAPDQVFDLAGASRRVDDPTAPDTGAGNAPVVDMGAFEFLPPPPPPCVADFNADGLLDPDDLADYIATYFATPPGPRADINQDAQVDPDDLSDFITAYFAGCPT